MKSLKGYLLILAATTFWGIAATIAKFLFTHDVDTLTLVQLRMTFSCIALLSYFAIFKRHFLKVQFKDFYKFAMLGILGAAGSNFTYYFTIASTNVSTAILLQYLAPLLVLLYAVITREEKITLIKITASVVSLVGCYFAVVGKDFSIISINQLGLLMGIASAFCWGFTNIWLKRLLKRYNVWTCLVYAFLFASIFWAIINPPWIILSAGYSLETWGIFFGFAMISILIPHSLYFSGMRYLTASRAIITATFEPIVAIISAYFIVHEVLSAVQIAGAVLVLLAIGILQLKQEEKI
ncbi:MAG: EamA family transporter [Ignavibacteriales bacterium]|nr:EamA family transporter [Ignavibacteriales bacterium]